MKPSEEIGRAFCILDILIKNNRHVKISTVLHKIVLLNTSLQDRKINIFLKLNNSETNSPCN